MSEKQEHPRLTEILSNPTLLESSLLPRERQASFKWHPDAALPQSSQAFCMSVFGGLRNVPTRDAIINDLLSSAVAGYSPAPGDANWEISLEHEDPRLLGEGGLGQPTSIDALCRSKDTFVALESKFLVDAAEGFGKCGQVRSKACRGYFGPGSDSRTGSDAWCRLENWDGKRAPRLYWTLGKRYFRAEIFERQSIGDECAFRGPSYQLMRNFLFAASMADRARKDRFHVLAIAPERFLGGLSAQVENFRKTVLAPKLADSIGITSYERMAQILSDNLEPGACELGAFITDRLATKVN